MEGTVRKSVVISAVNLRKGGTLTVLRDCLSYLSKREDVEVTALVHDKTLCSYPGIEYIEIPWSTKGWGRRLWCEYVTMHRISKDMDRVPDLWFSLHDTTPNVIARRQAVYCHTSFPFLKVKCQDWKMDPKSPLFANLTKFAYRINVRRNNYMVVQQDWFREGLSKKTGFPKEHIVVAPPAFSIPEYDLSVERAAVPTFIYPATPDCHKNFETLCEAARILQQEVGENRFQVILTLNGTENKYSSWLKKNWGDVSSVYFAGFQKKEDLVRLIETSTALVFPSRIESWGLPISEYIPTAKPMLLADLAYAHETSEGAGKVAFFDPSDPVGLSMMMKKLIHDDESFLSPVQKKVTEPPYASDWDELFNLLLTDENTSAR